jgi:hypothetical protein
MAINAIRRANFQLELRHEIQIFVNFKNSLYSDLIVLSFLVGGHSCFYNLFGCVVFAKSICRCTVDF